MQRELTFDDYVEMFRKRWPLVILITILGGALGYGLAWYLPKRYVSLTTVLVDESAVPKDYVPPTSTDDTNQRLAAMKEQILSQTHIMSVIRQFGLYREDGKRVPEGARIARLQNAIEVLPIQSMPGTDARELPGFTVSVTFEDARLAQQICSSITSLFVQENLKLRQDQAQRTTEFLSDQLADAKAKLDEQDAKLAVFKRSHLGSLPDQEQMNLNLLTNLSTQLEAATQAQGRARQDRAFTESLLSQQLAVSQAMQNGPSPESPDKQLQDLQSQLAVAQAKYTDKFPDVIRLKSDIEALKRKIGDPDKENKVPSNHVAAKADVESPQILQLRAQLHQSDQELKDRAAEQENIRREIRLYQDRVQGSPAVEEDYKSLTRDYQTALDFYNGLLKKRDESAMAADLERRQQGEQFKIYEAANLPTEPISPSTQYLILCGLTGGLAAGLGLAYIVEIRNKSLRTERDVELILQSPVLAMIPEANFANGNNWKRKADRLMRDAVLVGHRQISRREGHHEL